MFPILSLFSSSTRKRTGSAVLFLGLLALGITEARKNKEDESDIYVGYGPYAALDYIKVLSKRSIVIDYIEALDAIKESFDLSEKQVDALCNQLTLISEEGKERIDCAEDRLEISKIERDTLNKINRIANHIPHNAPELNLSLPNTPIQKETILKPLMNISDKVYTLGMSDSTLNDEINYAKEVIEFDKSLISNTIARSIRSHFEKHSI